MYLPHRYVTYYYYVCSYVITLYHRHMCLLFIPLEFPTVHQNSIIALAPKNQRCLKVSKKYLNLSSEFC